MKKKLPLLVVIGMMLVIGLAIYQYKANETTQAEIIGTKQIVQWRLIELKEIKVVVEDRQMRFAPNPEDQGAWWMYEPHLYPANQEILLATFEMMGKVLADEAFQKESDKYGFAKPMGAINLVNLDGREQSLVIGSVDAPGNRVYVENSIDQNVYVVHNAWAQFLHQDVMAFINNRIQWGEGEVTKFEFNASGKEQWSAEKNSDGKWYISQSGKTIKLKPKQLFDLWKKLHRVKLSNHRFNNESGIESGYIFNIRTEDGKNTNVVFNPNMNEVYLAGMKAIASVNPDEIKVIISAVENVLAGSNEKSN